MTRIKSLWNVLAAVVAIVVFPSLVQAATVSWSSLSSITSNNDIVNAGGVVPGGAINFTSDVGNILVTVGGDTVTFVPDTVGGISLTGAGTTNFDTTATSVTANFDSVLESFGFYNGAGSTTRTFSGLTAGGTYTVQPFVSDDPSTNWVGMTFTIGGVASSVHDTAGGADPNGSGRSPFSTATVVLGSAEDSFSVVISSTSVSVVNALVVAQVPEPTGLALLSCALATVGFLGRRRRNRG